MFKKSSLKEKKQNRSIANMDLLKFRGRMEEWASPADRSHPDGDNKNCYVLDSSGKSEIKRRPYICQKHATNAFLKFQ